MSIYKHIDVGDIVSIDSEEDTLYIVLSIDDFSDEEIVDFDYKLARIYPLRKTSQKKVEGYSNVTLYTKRNSTTYNLLMKKLKLDREKKGWGDNIDYLDIVESNRSKVVKKKQPVRIDVTYSIYETVDQCLDAINDLNGLYEMFQDEEFLEKKKVVIKRLKQIKKKK